MGTFATPEDVMKAIVTKTPFFIEKLDEANLRARGVRSHGEYFERYEEFVLEFTRTEKSRIHRLALIAKYKCRRQGMSHLLDVNWWFAKCDDRLENGYPHTIGGIIVLPKRVMQYDDSRLIKLMVHEATHVHQRAYPEFAARQVRALGFVPVRTWENHRESLRANPDTNNMIYANADGMECNPVLHQDARSLSEVSLKPYRTYPGFTHIQNPEHVFEIIAELNANAV